MRSILARGAGIPILVGLIFIVGSQSGSVNHGDLAGEPVVSVAADAGRDRGLSPADAPVASESADLEDVLDFLREQASGLDDASVFASLCMTASTCVDGLPVVGPPLLPTRAPNVNHDVVHSVDTGETGERLELVGHGWRETGDDWQAPDHTGGATVDGRHDAGFGAFVGAGDFPLPIISAMNAAERFSDPNAPLYFLIYDLLTGGAGKPQIDSAELSSDTAEEQEPAGAGGERGEDSGGPADVNARPSFSVENNGMTNTPGEGENATLAISEVPEPASLALLGAGLLLVVRHLRQRKSRA